MTGPTTPARACSAAPMFGLDPKRRRRPRREHLRLPWVEHLPPLQGYLQISTRSLPDATVHKRYTAKVATSGGDPPIALTAETAKFDGLTFHGGTITGTPKRTGVFRLKIQAHDSSKPTPQTSQRTLKLIVKRAQATTTTRRSRKLYTKTQKALLIENAEVNLAHLKYDQALFKGFEDELNLGDLASRLYELKEHHQEGKELEFLISQAYDRDVKRALDRLPETPAGEEYKRELEHFFTWLKPIFVRSVELTPVGLLGMLIDSLRTEAQHQIGEYKRQNLNLQRYFEHYIDVLKHDPSDPDDAQVALPATLPAATPNACPLILSTPLCPALEAALGSLQQAWRSSTVAVELLIETANRYGTAAADASSSAMALQSAADTVDLDALAAATQQTNAANSSLARVFTVNALRLPLLSKLAGAIPTGAIRSAAGSLSVAQLVELLAALAPDLPSSQLSALSSDLAAAQNDIGPARAAALSRFASDADNPTSDAGAYLAAAALDASGDRAPIL